MSTSELQIVPSISIDTKEKSKKKFKDSATFQSSIYYSHASRFPIIFRPVNNWLPW